MRKLYFISLSLFITITILFSAAAPTYAYDTTQGVLLNINGQRVETEVPPVILSGTTFVPLRAVFEKLGATVNWISNEKSVTIKYKDKSITLYVNNTKVIINGVSNKLDKPAFIKNGRTMIPIRFVSENLGMTVGWYSPKKLVTIVEPSYYNNLGNTTVLAFTTNDYRGDNYSFDSLKANYTGINSIATFSYHLTSGGKLELTGESQQDTVRFVNSNKIRPLVLIHNLVGGSFNSALAHSVLSDSNKRKSIIDSILFIMARDQYSGVNVDIENIFSTDRGYYSTFIKELKNKLSSYGYLTTVSIPAKTSDMKTSKWSGGYDYAVIGKYADQILLMTYDEHYFGGAAGPIASAPWVENVLKYASSQIPSKKILVGIAGYGYDWSSTGNKVVTFNGVENVISQNVIQPQWDDTAKSPYYEYTKDGVQHTVWYENTQSIGYKLDLVHKYNLGGIGIWKLGYENSNFWSAIEDKLG
jgi:spore germination protein YaaH